jgi:ornithine cyclodeaminase
MVRATRQEVKKVLVLPRSQIRRLLDPAALLAALREAFVVCSGRIDDIPGRMPINLPQDSTPPSSSGMIVGPGIIPGIPAYSVKVHAKFPAQQPAITGVLLLHDLQVGRLLAIMESSYLTALRTGLVGALAADVLSRPESRRVAVIGAGAQGRMQLSGLRLVRPISHVHIYDADREAAAAFAADAVCRGLEVTTCRSAAEAIGSADIAVTATWATSPFLFEGDTRPGLHITTLGADQPGKCELSAGVLSASRVVVDSRLLAMTMGAVGGAGASEGVIQAELGEVLSGQMPGRVSDSDVTVFASVGLPFQDLAAAWLVYRAALERNDIYDFRLLD